MTTGFVGAALLATSLAVLAWTYVLYPAFVVLLARVAARPWRIAPYTGSVSVIVPAHNEDKVLRQKIENSLSLRFGGADAEVIVVSDGSVDGTEAIMESYREHPEARAGRLKLIAYQPRAGKPNALHRGIEAARGDVLILSDANVYLEPDAPAALLAPFADPEVGAVCGKVLIRASGGEEIAGEGLYMRYEGVAQRAEAALWTMIGVDGALYALRREHYRRLDSDLVLDDFALSTGVIERGQRIAYADDAVAVEEMIASAAGEYKRKKRIIGGGYQFLARFLQRGGTLPAIVWPMFVSHKILRWASPLFLATALFGNLLALGLPGFGWLLAAQAALYAVALTGAASTRLRDVGVVYVPYYFCLINAAAGVGLIEFLRKQQSTLWDKVDR